MSYRIVAVFAAADDLGAFAIIAALISYAFCFPTSKHGVPFMSVDTAPAPEKKKQRSESEPVAQQMGQVKSPFSIVEEAIRSIRYGTVQIVIQDGHIVQIDKTEKIRLR